MPASCFHCEGAVTPTTPSLKCNGACKKHFHVNCLNLPEPDLVKFTVNKDPWSCSKCLIMTNITSAPITFAQMEQLMKNQLDVLKAEFFNKIDDYFGKLDNRVSAVENDVKLLRNELDTFKNSGTCNVDSVIEEIEDRKQRASNILLFNIKESSATNVAERVADDFKKS